MFKALQELAQKSTLLITIAPEGDLLRVNITPTANNAKDTPALRPLSLLASAEELDRDFAPAMQMWTTPRRSLLEQVSAAAEEDDAGEKEQPNKVTGGKGKAQKEPKPPKTPKDAGKTVGKAADGNQAADIGDGKSSPPGDGDSPLPVNGESRSPATPGAQDASAAAPAAEVAETPAPTPNATDAAPQSGGGEPSPTVNGESPSPASGEQVASAALDKPWQIPKASNQPPPVPIGEPEKTASPPPPAAPAGEAFLECF